MLVVLKARLDAAFGLTGDLVAHLDEASLGLDLPRLASNRISGQLWCVVGARESYGAAIEAGAWRGFSCGLRSPGVKSEVLSALESTRRRIGGIDFQGLDDARVGFALALLEHEVQHHGQLIRYVYGNGLSFPESWKERYTV